MRALSLFTGAGGLDMAVEAFFGCETVARSDIKPAACKLIEHYWPGTNLGDITRIDFQALGPIDVVAGGFPCTDVSMAGRRAGLKRGETRSGLWGEMCRAIETLRPRFVVAENVRGLLSADADCDMEPCPTCVGDRPDIRMRALGAVLADLAHLGYDAQWCGLRAADVGAPHGRWRVFILACDTDGMAGPAGGPLGGRRGAVAQPGTVERAERPDRGVTTDAYGGPAERERGLGSVAGPSGCGEGVGGEWQRVRDALGYRGEALADADSIGGLGRGETGRHTLLRGVGGDPGRCDGATDAVWGDYTTAIRRWEHILGRPAPAPTVLGPNGGRRLNPDLVDWMMGWPAGWTDVPGVTRSERLSLGGDGVVPQQAFAALHWLWRNAIGVAA